MKTPPLCPNTRASFDESSSLYMYRSDLSVVVVAVSTDRFGRECIARYQACAWMDEAHEWAIKSSCPGDAAWSEMDRCHAVSRCWREWERQK